MLSPSHLFAIALFSFSQDDILAQKCSCQAHRHAHNKESYMLLHITDVCLCLTCLVSHHVTYRGGACYTQYIRLNIQGTHAMCPITQLGCCPGFHMSHEAGWVGTGVVAEGVQAKAVKRAQQA